MWIFQKFSISQILREINFHDKEPKIHEKPCKLQKDFIEMVDSTKLISHKNLNGKKLAFGKIKKNLN